MSNRNLRRIFFNILFPCLSIAQVSSALDTVSHFHDNNIVELSHPFILESSIVISQNAHQIQFRIIDAIEGRIYLKEFDNKSSLIIKYDYLTNKLPISFGPKWKMLPPLNEINIEEKEPLNPLNNKIKNKNSELFTSGNIYRNLTVSPLGGSDFTGGLQMQLTGKLTENISVSGVLTDQDLPIQPEGVTRNLDELDKVYVTVNHPNYKVEAGDILYKHSDINRKLVGLKNNFNINSWRGSGVYGGSKGTFSSLAMKGRDRDQGPYLLRGNTENRNIIILSGTEKIWLDGIELIRGLNHDYTIDYSLGEIRFTPKNLIHSDSDIFVEFEYSDFQFTTGFTGGTMKKKIGKSSFLDFGFYKESDQYQKSDWNQELLDSLTSSGENAIRISTVVENEDGDYIIAGRRYEYSPGLDSKQHYSVVFEYDTNGSYIRKISNSGRIYYQFSDLSSTAVDRYSPFRIINAPKSHLYGFVGGNTRLGKHFSVKTKFVQTGLDNNSINLSTSPEPGYSHEIGLNLDSLEFGPVNWSISISDWKRSQSYTPLGQENDVMQNRLWNLDSSIISGIRISKLNSTFRLKEIGKTDVEISQLTMPGSERSRGQIRQSIVHPLFDKSFANYLRVQKEIGTFIKQEGRFQINYKSISPFVRYISEEESMNSHFENLGGGLNIKLNNKLFESGIGVRDDKVWLSTSSWENLSQDFIGFFNYRFNSSNGFKQNIIYQKRIKSTNNSGSSYDYTLAKVKLSYQKSTKPIQWEIEFKTEESFSEERAIVYDSVGAGLGQFRYDPIFNTYVSDPNGAFISYRVLTGKRNPNTVFDGLQKFEVDLGKINGFPNLLFRGNFKFDYRGRSLTMERIIQPTLIDTMVSLSNFNSRLEIIYSGKRRIGAWIENQQFFNGLDPRGNDLNKKQEFGFDFDYSFTKNSQFTNKGSIRTKLVESSISSLRNREVNGWWNESTIKVRMNSSIDIDFGMIGGFDRGIQQEGNFQANALGFKIDGRLFFKKTGRIQTGLSWVKSEEMNNASFLPPEALNGFPIGSSFRSNTRIQYFINQSVSMIFSLNTIDDKRYNNFMTFQGEIRAHF